MLKGTWSLRRVIYFSVCSVCERKKGRQKKGPFYFLGFFEGLINVCSVCERKEEKNKKKGPSFLGVLRG